MTKTKNFKLLGALFFFALALFFLTSSKTLYRVQAFSSGPPGGNTGAPGDLTCAVSGCHGGTPNSGPGQFTITGLPARYDPGMTYQVTVSHSTTDTTRLRWGFQLTVLNASNAKAGELANNSGLTTILDNDGRDGNRQYIEHNLSGTFAGQSNGASWTLNWTAPAANIGPITFYAAGNQANNNNNNTGDQIYTTSLTINPPAASSGTPRITNARVQGKQLIVSGENFDIGATLFMNGARVKKTGNDETTPATVLIARKGGNLIAPGQTVALQVKNTDGTASENFSFTRPQ
ncbi:MAG: hypothetical protein HY231_14850 [Acidobacteria bacterium]|nr:hypothetical protein [Acidobacteriota bacterium]